MVFKKTLLTIALSVSMTLPSYSQTHQFHKPGKFVENLKKENNPAKKIYQAFCANCHDKEPLIEVQAPKFRHMPDWQLRLKQSSQVIFKHVDEGLNAMPPRGGCFECTDQSLREAIKYMLPNSK